MWEILIIPIIGVGVWIISTLLRGEENAKKPGAGPRGQRKSDKATDLDRFLREVQRRRQTAEQKQETPQPVEDSREEEEPTSPPREEPVPVVVVEEAVVVPQVFAPAPLLVAKPIVTSPQLTVHEAPSLPQLQPTVAPSPGLPRAPESPALVGVRELLRSRDGLRKAMILSVVLGAPVSRRR
jgi:hypothetical protein